MILSSPAGSFQRLIAATVAAGMTLTVGAALAFQHIGGYIPCKLCLEQRIPYYVGIPVMALAMMSAWLRWPAIATRGLLLAGGLIMVWSLYLGVFHAGVEWGWWIGPADCGLVATPPASAGGGGILDQIDTAIPPSCDKATLRVLGLSFAGWNAVASLALAVIAFAGALRR